MTGIIQHPLTGDAILPPEWYLKNTDPPPATEYVEEPEEPTEQPTADAVTATIVTEPAATQPQTTQPLTTQPQTTQPVETVTAAEQGATVAVQPTTVAVGSHSNDALVNTLFVVLPLLLVAIAVLIGLLIARKRKAAAMTHNSAVRNPDRKSSDRGEPR